MNNSKIKRKGDLNSYQVEREEHDWKYHATVFVYITSPHTKHLGNKIDCINHDGDADDDDDNDDAADDANDGHDNVDDDDDDGHANVDDDDDDGHDNVDDDDDISPY